MKCPRCQHDNPHGARFCEECADPAGQDLLELRGSPIGHGEVLPRVCSSRFRRDGGAIAVP